MSNTAKFPARRNERRIRALSRIERQIEANIKRNNGAEWRLTAEERSRLSREAKALSLRIRPFDVVRAIRTKKDRSGTGKLSRSA